MRAVRVLALIACAVTGFHPAIAIGQPLAPTGEIDLQGDMPEGKDLSGVTLAGDRLVLCPDEGAAFYVLRKKDESTYELTDTVSMDDDEDAELELEGAASHGKFIYLIGSHSLRRKTVDASRTYAENRKRMGKVEPHDDGYCLFRLELDDDGKATAQKEISLRELIEADPGAAPFLDVPSKENGIDIEGIAVKDDRLFVGFRGPVMRGGFVPVAVLKFKEPESYEVRFVQLDGRGIRDITAVDDGFLIIGGPVGDGDGEFRVYHWNGEDCVPGDGGKGGAVRTIGILPTTPGSNPEGIAVLEEGDDEWQVLIVGDGDAAALRFELERP